MYVITGTAAPGGIGGADDGASGDLSDNKNKNKMNPQFLEDRMKAMSGLFLAQLTPQVWMPRHSIKEV